MKSIVPVNNVPFLKETRHERQDEFILHPSVLKVESTNKSLDTPFADNFLIRE